MFDGTDEEGFDKVDMSSQVTMPRDTVQKIGSVQLSALADSKASKLSAKDNFLREYRRSKDLRLAQPESSLDMGASGANNGVPLAPTDVTAPHKYSESARSNWSTHPESNVKNPARWQAGKEFYQSGSTSTNMVVRKQNSRDLSYYLFWGDWGAKVAQIRNPEKRTIKMIEIHHRDPEWRAIPAREQKSIEIDARAKAYWSRKEAKKNPDDPDRLILRRGQAANKISHDACWEKIRRAFDVEMAATGKLPSRNRLAKLSGCRKDAVSTFLKQVDPAKSPSYIEQISSSLEQKECSIYLGAMDGSSEKTLSLSTESTTAEILDTLVMESKLLEAEIQTKISAEKRMAVDMSTWKATSMLEIENWFEIPDDLTHEEFTLLSKLEKNRRATKRATAAAIASTVSRETLKERREPQRVPCDFCGEDGYLLLNPTTHKYIFTDIVVGMTHLDQFQYGVHVAHLGHCKDLAKQS